MTLRVGVFLHNLRQERPRGVARVARALAERLANDLSIETYAISAPRFDVSDIVVNAWPLRIYLDAVPLDIGAARRTQKANWRERTLYRLRWVTRTPHLARWVHWLSRKIGVLDRMRNLYREIEGLSRAGEIAGEYERSLPCSGMALSRFDVVVGFEVYESIWDWPLESACKSVCMIYDMIPLRIYEGPDSRPGEYFRQVGKVVLRADALVCISHSTNRDLLAFFPAAEGKSHVVHIGHDIGRFSPGGASTRRPGNRRRILMVGDIDRRKNVQSMFRSMPIIASMAPDHEYELAIVGNDSQRRHFADLEREAAKFALVTWSGYVPDEELPAFYREADVFVFPSIWEGFGIPIAEAMTLGVPVVCSELSSMPEVAGEWARYCDPYVPTSIAKAIIDTLNMTPEERELWISGARAHAARFTWDKAAAELVAIVKRTCELGLTDDYKTQFNMNDQTYGAARSSKKESAH